MVAFAKTQEAKELKETEILEPTKNELEKIIPQKYKVIYNSKEHLYHSLPKTLRENSTYIGSSFQTNNGRIIANPTRGLDQYQERYFATALINKTPMDEGFTDSMLKFWADKRIFVSEQEMFLDASYVVRKVKIGNEDVEIEIPVNLQEYIDAKFLLNNARVAFSEERKMNSDLYDVLMFDISIEEKKKISQFEIQNNADIAYVKLMDTITQDKSDKVDWIVDLIKEPQENFTFEKINKKLAKIKEYSVKYPSNFVEICNDPNLEMKAFLNACIQTGVIQKSGEVFFYQEENLGKSQKEVVEFIKDQTKSGFVLKMKAEVAAAKQKKLK